MRCRHELIHLAHAFHFLDQEVLVFRRLYVPLHERGVRLIAVQHHIDGHAVVCVVNEEYLFVGIQLLERPLLTVVLQVLHFQLELTVLSPVVAVTDHLARLSVDEAIGISRCHNIRQCRPCHTPSAERQCKTFDNSYLFHKYEDYYCCRTYTIFYKGTLLI